MERWHLEVRHCRRESCCDVRHNRDPWWAAQLGRYRKRKALDCGNPRCGVCHSDKFPKRDLTPQERRAEITKDEQM